jgi:hypothetical protein
MFQLTEKSAVYKLLATALSECLASEGDKNSNLEKYSKLIHGLGYDLINMLKEVNFELHVQEPYFTQLKGTFSGYLIVVLQLYLLNLTFISGCLSICQMV